MSDTTKAEPTEDNTGILKLMAEAKHVAAMFLYDNCYSSVGDDYPPEETINKLQELLITWLLKGSASHNG